MTKKEEGRRKKKNGKGRQKGRNGREEEMEGRIRNKKKFSVLGCRIVLWVFFFLLCEVSACD